MVEIELKHVQLLRETIDNASVSSATRSLAVRVFCNEFKPNGPQAPRTSDDTAKWTKVDTDHVLELSYDFPRLANYLVERVVAAE